jgi:O-antigen/teichoic acid export membrane protein
MAGRALTQGLYFLLLAGVLGPAELGRLAIFTAITTTLAPLSGVGCSEVLLKNTARDPGALAHGYGHCRGIIPVSALAIALPAAAAGWACLDLARDWPTLLCLGAIDIVALRYQEVLLAMTQALEDFKANASIALVMSLAKLAGVGAMLVLPVPRTVAGWSVVQLAALGPATALLCRWCRRRYLAVPAGWRIDPALVREGTLFAVGVSVNGAYRDIDKLFLGKVVASAQLGLYATAYRLLDLAFIPVRAMLYVALPRMFRSGGRDSGAGGDRRFVARSLLAALAAFLAYQAALHGLPWLLGQRFQGIGAMGRILGLMLFGRTLLNYGAYRVLTGRGVKYSCLVQGLAALASLVLCWALIPGGGWRAAAWISVGTDFLFAGLYLVLCRPNRRPVPEQP